MGAATKAGTWIIADGNDRSAEAIHLGEYQLVGIYVPSTWDADAALGLYSATDKSLDDEALALVLEVVPDSYRVLTTDEQYLARGLMFTSLVSVDPDTPSSTIDQDSGPVSLQIVAEYR